MIFWAGFYAGIICTVAVVAMLIICIGVGWWCDHQHTDDLPEADLIGGIDPKKGIY
jgi:hypothetical protein